MLLSSPEEIENRKSWPALCRPIALLVGWMLLPAAVHAAGYLAALESITIGELRETVEVLSDDVYEGRAAGSRGGHAAGHYILQEIRPMGLTPPGPEGFLQPFDDDYRNILALYPGSDPELKDRFIIVGAHYDHVGRGDSGRARGPIGVIYNGADDNASGVAAMLEVMEAITSAKVPTRRSILFVFWDGEEIGLLGSRHWLRHPTLPREKLDLVINIDMVGRLEEGRLYVLGTRTGYGLRRLASGSLPESLSLNVPWDLEGNSDHWSFYRRHYPVLMLHTGLHEDYHRPSDDADKINGAGMLDVSRYLLDLVVRAANADSLPPFREDGEYESQGDHRDFERPLSKRSVSSWPRNEPRPRVGISWRKDDAEPGTVFLTRVVEGSPAQKAGLKVHDRIYALAGSEFADDQVFNETIARLLDEGATQIEFTIERRGHVQTVTVPLPLNIPTAPPAE